MTQDLEINSLSDLSIQSPFWKEKINSLSHPVAIRMAHDLDVAGPLGIGDGTQPFWKGFKHSDGKKDSNIDFLLRVRKQHPNKIALVQIGEFYETWGIDSVFLVEHCGINRMGRKGPRAGMPLANIQSVLNDLTDAGFSIVVCEQADDAHRKGRKIRFISEVITPSSPTYTYGLAMSHKTNICFPEAPPEFGIALDMKGIKLVEVNPDLRTSLILEGLTEEAAIIRLNKYSGRMNRIFLHEKVPCSLLDAANLKFQNLIKISGYSSREFPDRIEELIKLDLGLDANLSFLKTKSVSSKNCPHPLYQGSAEQIGILPKRGIPDLVELMLPKGSPATCKHIIRNLLLNPPPQEFANSLRKSIWELQSNASQLPDLIVSNPVRYVKTLHKKEAHPEILKDLFLLCEIFLNCQKNLSKKFISNILEIISYISSIKAERDVLSDTSRKIIDILQPIIPKEEDSVYVPSNELISRHLFERIEEEFRGRIARTSNDKVAKLYDKADRQAKKYEKIINEKLIGAIEETKAKNATKNKRIALTYDIHNQAIWIIGAIDADIVKKYNLIRPIDRYGKEVKDRWSVSIVEETLTKYKEIASDTYDEIKKVLQKASKDLSPYCLPIIHLATFSNLAKTLYLHIKECSVKHWTSNFELKKDKSNNIILEEFFPYWMRANEAKKNSLSFNGACLLTGHNMSGKSTLIRSLATTTLLASIGFMFPAKKVSLAQEIDGWFVRTGAQDDPEAGLSSFAVEMTDIKVALRDASNKSFLLIDELGKGTESKAGHAIAASVLEYLIAKNIRSIFATHWHEIFANKVVKIQDATLINMICEGDNPTYEVGSGVDLKSSAFYTAKKIGIDTKIINRAQEIAQGYSHINSENMCATQSKNEENHSVIAKKMLAKVAKQDIKYIKTLSPRQIPPLNDIGYSVVYVLKTPNNFFYAGESDNFLNRVKSHRKRLLSDECEFFYLVVKEGKSAARKIEQELIVKLKNNALPMLSIADGANLNFGVA